MPWIESKISSLERWDHLFCQNLSTSGCTQSRCFYGKYIQDHFCLISLWAKATFKLKSTSWMPVRCFTDIVTQTISYWSYKRVSFSEDLCHGNKALNVCWGEGGMSGPSKTEFHSGCGDFFLKNILFHCQFYCTISFYLNYRFHFVPF